MAERTDCINHEACSWLFIGTWPDAPPITAIPRLSRYLTIAGPTSNFDIDHQQVLDASDLAETQQSTSNQFSISSSTVVVSFYDAATLGCLSGKTSDLDTLRVLKHQLESH
jgi:hypothetical protein